MGCGGESKFSGSGDPSGGGSTIQNGRLTTRRNAYFSRRLYRVSQLIQHPSLLTFREFCFIVWALYASYQLYFSTAAAWQLLAVVDVRVLCATGLSFMGCSWDVFWRLLFIFYLYLAEVVPWAILSAAVVFVGEEVMRRR
ncbi:hypothetical protein VP1G_04682 [Cytospora mali]|uniref:Uncharacterized protein n=1 Tax=Cytospora mali TaxID=578113 RepID=A0A194V0D0_CYTMA|nr:hypothetical protein VP1G_04682 [Valsa mali var. pyri (nom. inval.)]